MYFLLLDFFCLNWQMLYRRVSWPPGSAAAARDSELDAADEVRARGGRSQIRRVTVPARGDPSGCGATACCRTMMLDGGLSRQLAVTGERCGGRMAGAADEPLQAHPQNVQRAHTT